MVCAMKRGVIASEYPPDAGGMQKRARRLLECLSQAHDIQLFTVHHRDFRPVLRRATANLSMQWRETFDIAQLNRLSVQAWMLLNARLCPYMCHLDSPAFAPIARGAISNQRIHQST